jgi:hypothetical protein
VSPGDASCPARGYSDRLVPGAWAVTELPAGLSARGPAEVLGRPCQARWQSGWAGPAAGWAGPWRLQCAMAAPVEAAGGANRAGLVPGTRLLARKLHAPLHGTHVEHVCAANIHARCSVQASSRAYRPAFMRRTYTPCDEHVPEQSHSPVNCTGHASCRIDSDWTGWVPTQIP